MQFTYNFSVPYVTEYQHAGLRNFVQVWQDSTVGNQTIVRDFVETVTTIAEDHARYSEYPARDHWACLYEDTSGSHAGPTRKLLASEHAEQKRFEGKPHARMHGGEGVEHEHARMHGGEGFEGPFARPMLPLLGRDPARRPSLSEDRLPAGAPGTAEATKKHLLDQLQFVLPDLSDTDRWVHVGSTSLAALAGMDPASLRGPSSASALPPLTASSDVLVYEWNLSRDGMPMAYKFYVTPDGTPVRLYQLGVNLYTGGHRDEYISDFGNWTVGEQAIPEGVFDKPTRANCTADLDPGAATLAQLIATAFPPRHFGDGDYDAHVHATGRRHASRREYELRREAFADSASFVRGWEAQRRGEEKRYAAHLDAARRHLRGRGIAEDDKAALADLLETPAFAAVQPPRHSVALNRFADWTREEWAAVTRPRGAAGRRAEHLAKLAQLPTRNFAHELEDAKRRAAVRDDAALAAAETTAKANVSGIPRDPPSALSWRGTPFDSPVKDQGACGSCWTFSTIGPIESAWYYQKGKQQLFSEQNILDCNWDEVNHGCYGGEQIHAFDWIFNVHRGLAANDEYPYKGSNGFCRTRVAGADEGPKVPEDVPELPEAPKIDFTGKAVLIEGGAVSVKLAVYERGPITVSIDASHDDFRFYSGGIYRNPTCEVSRGHLDHAVILSGYGVADDGEDFWLIKNMWSPYWGEGGYMRVGTKGGNDCGVASEPLYVELEILDGDNEQPKAAI